MKKAFPYALIFLCILIFTISIASAENKQCDSPIILELQTDEVPRGSSLPASLVVIEDEAFEGTALVKVDIPQDVIAIGDRAFANISSLREIRMPITTSHIASTAFQGSDRTTIMAPENSYACAYARTHGVPFSPIVMFCASTQTTVTSVISIDSSKGIIESDSSIDFKPENQLRRIEEINATRTEELIANHVQGRSPPMV